MSLVKGVSVLSDGETEATDEQIETKETRIAEFEKRSLRRKCGRR